jgi:hypothetical protein
MEGSPSNIVSPVSYGYKEFIGRYGFSITGSLQ